MGLASDPIISSKAWVVMGDFNQILNPSESSTGSARISMGISDFRHCISSANLFDLSFRGNLFTWWNNQEANPIVKKLDRVLINGNWQLNFSDSYADFGDIDVSDHRPCCLIMGTSKRPKVPFKISHFLFQHKEFLPRTAIHWS